MRMLDENMQPTHENLLIIVFEWTLITPPGVEGADAQGQQIRHQRGTNQNQDISHNNSF